jgi:o-succinylbenzoate synthase
VGVVIPPLVAYRVRVPLRVPLNGARTREVNLLHGPAGWGEWSPLPGYPCDPAAARRAAEEAAAETWPEAVRRTVAVNGLVPAVGPEEAAQLAGEARAAGITTLKVKVGGGPLSADLDRVAAVRGALGPAGRIRLDANGAWSPEEAEAALAPHALARYDLELVEQPVAGIDELARLRRRVAPPLGADECVRSIGDARRLAALHAADAVVLKVQPLGGVWAAMAVAEAAGVPVIVSSLYETSIGLAAGLALAAALDDLPFACGLGTAVLLAGDVVADPLLPVGGMLAVRRPVPDPVLLERYAVL